MPAKNNKTNKTTDDPVTPMQERFAEEVANPLNKNATQAAIKAGASKKSARVTASKWLTKANILKLIAKRREEIQKLNEITAEEVKKGVSELAAVSIVDLIGDDGKIDLVALRAAGLGRFIKEYVITETYTKEGGLVVKTSVKGYSRLDAYKELAEYHGIKQLPRENARTLQATVKAIHHYMIDHPNANRDEVIKVFTEGRKLDPETVQEHLESIQ